MTHGWLKTAFHRLPISDSQAQENTGVIAISSPVREAEYNELN